MALVAIETEKISQRAAAEKFAVSESMLRRKAGKITHASNDACVIKEPQPVITKDGRLRHPPASPELINKAWELKDAGSNTAEIARVLERSWMTVNKWLSRSRPEPTAPIEPPPLILEPPVTAPNPKRPQVPANLKQANRKEQKWVKERWLPIVEHLAAAEKLIRFEHQRLQVEYAGPQGSLMMVNRWEAIAKLWEESGTLGDFPAITGKPETATVGGLLSEMERMARVSGQLVGSIETWTGCKPDLTRYTP